jgi:hypothetical protein
VSAGGLQPEFEPRLVEAAVHEAVRGHGEERAFHGEREAVYEIGEAEAREAGFDALHVRWFERLALDRPFGEVLAGEPAIAAGCGRWLVAGARDRRDEAADLLVAAGDRPTLVVLVMPQTVATPERLRLLLRRELLRVGDMLDPGFGYEPAPPPGAAGAGGGGAARAAYRVLWDAYVDGRLVRLGVLPGTVRQDRLKEFVRAFGDLDAGGEIAFERFFGGQPLTHGELVAFARSGWAGGAAGRRSGWPGEGRAGSAADGGGRPPAGPRSEGAGALRGPPGRGPRGSGAAPARWRRRGPAG